MRDEWWMVAGLCALPFLLFGLVEILAARRRRRREALARRSKQRLDRRR